MEKTLREALRNLIEADEMLYNTPPIVTGDDWLKARESSLAEARAALENTQGEDREADRPDAEKALEESVSSSYWLRAPLTYADLVEMNLTDKHPNLAKWLKSRGAE